MKMPSFVIIYWLLFGAVFLALGLTIAVTNSGN